MKDQTTLLYKLITSIHCVCHVYNFSSTFDPCVYHINWARDTQFEAGSHHKNISNIVFTRDLFRLRKMVRCFIFSDTLCVIYIKLQYLNQNQLNRKLNNLELSEQFCKYKATLQRSFILKTTEISSRDLINSG